MSNENHPSFLSVIPVVLTMIIIMINKPLDVMPMSLIGDWSYSIYLIHWPTILIVKEVFIYYYYYYFYKNSVD